MHGCGLNNNFVTVEYWLKFPACLLLGLLTVVVFIMVVKPSTNKTKGKMCLWLLPCNTLHHCNWVYAGSGRKDDGEWSRCYCLTWYGNSFYILQMGVLTRARVHAHRHPHELTQLEVGRLQSMRRLTLHVLQHFKQVIFNSPLANMLPQAFVWLCWLKRQLADIWK